jgi:hypothetical protein
MSRLVWFESSMSRARLIVAHALIAMVLFGSLAAIVAGRDLWPFCQYPMYAALVHGRTEWFWLYGESAAGEIPLHGYRYLNPAGEQRLAVGLRLLAERPRGATLVRDALARLAARYEAARLAGRHDGPELRALRVYEVSWDVRSRRPTPRPPDERVLYGEVLLDHAH